MSYLRRFLPCLWLVVVSCESPTTAPTDAVTASGESALDTSRIAAATRDDAPPAKYANWSQFRGDHALGLAPDDAETAVEWDFATQRNIAWKTPIPGLGHSSPVIWGDRLFVTTAVRARGEADLSSLYGSPGYGSGDSVPDEGEIEFRVYCLDKSTGEVLWQQSAHVGVPRTKRHPKSTHANPTPACTADRLVVSFGSEGIVCFDHDGEEIWRAEIGYLNNGAPGYGDENYQWGHASSPVIHGDKVVVQCDHEGPSFLAAYSLVDGREIWRVDRDEDSTWGTPTVHESAAHGRPQVIVNGYRHIGGYDLETGEEIWKLSGGGDVPIPTPVVRHDLVFLTSAHGRSRPVRAVRIDAEGELDPDPDAEPHLVWSLPRRGIYNQTPIVVGDLLYCCSDGGALGCYDARTGEEKYRERLGGGSTGFSGSAVAAGDKLYFTGESGTVFVVRAGPEFELLAENELGETCLSTPAISDGRLYFRTRGHIVAVARDASGS